MRRVEHVAHEKDGKQLGIIRKLDKEFLLQCQKVFEYLSGSKEDLQHRERGSNVKVLINGEAILKAIQHYRSIIQDEITGFYKSQGPLTTEERMYNYTVLQELTDVLVSYSQHFRQVI